MSHQDRVTSVTFSLDGKSLMTGSKDKTARLWNAADCTPIGPPLQHQRAVTTVALSPDAKFAVTRSDDGTTRLWTLPTAP